MIIDIQRVSVQPLVSSICFRDPLPPKKNSGITIPQMDVSGIGDGFPIEDGPCLMILGPSF